MQAEGEGGQGGERRDPTGRTLREPGRKDLLVRCENHRPHSLECGPRNPLEASAAAGARNGFCSVARGTRSSSLGFRLRGCGPGSQAVGVGPTRFPNERIGALDLRVWGSRRGGRSVPERNCPAVSFGKRRGRESVGRDANPDTVDCGGYSYRKRHPRGRGSSRHLRSGGVAHSRRRGEWIVSPLRSGGRTPQARASANATTSRPSDAATAGSVNAPLITLSPLARWGSARMASSGP